MIGIRGIRTYSPLKMVVSIKFGKQFLMVNPVPLQKFGAFKLVKFQMVQMNKNSVG